MSLAHSALLAAQEAAIAANVASAPTPLFWLTFDGDVVDSGSSPQSWSWILAGTSTSTSGSYTADGSGYGGTGRAANFTGASGMPVVTTRVPGGFSTLSRFSIVFDLKLTGTDHYDRPLMMFRSDLTLKWDYLGNLMLSCDVFSGGGWTKIIDTGINTSWHRVSIAYDGSKIMSSLDGGDFIDQRSGLSGTLNLSSQDLYIGSNGWSASGFSGYIDNFKFYSEVTK